MIEYSDSEGTVTLTVRVIPRSSNSEIVGEHGGALKVKLSSPPADGAANGELIRLLAKFFDVSRSDVEIASGQTSRTKKVSIAGGDIEKIRRVLQAKS